MNTKDITNKYELIDVANEVVNECLNQLDVLAGGIRYNKALSNEEALSLLNLLMSCKKGIIQTFNETMI